MATGIDYNRMVLLTAVLEKKLGLKLSLNDVYLNVVGGLKIDERAADLAVMAAVVSSLENRPVKRGAVAIGEAGLTGEMRVVGAMEKRVAECEKLGFMRCVVPGRIAHAQGRRYETDWGGYGVGSAQRIAGVRILVALMDKIAFEELSSLYKTGIELP